MVERGYVYWLQAEDGTGPIKIGFTRHSAEQRLKTIQGCSPVRLALIATQAAPWWVELELHRFLAPHRLHGEWFRDCAEVRGALEGCVRAATERTNESVAA